MPPLEGETSPLPIRIPMPTCPAIPNLSHRQDYIDDLSTVGRPAFSDWLWDHLQQVSGPQNTHP